MVYQSSHAAPADATYVQPALQRPRKRRTGMLVLTGIILLITLGIAGAFAYVKSEQPRAVAGSTAAASQSPVVQAPATVAPSPAAAAPKIGQEIAWPDGLRATAFAWKQPVAKSAPEPSEAGEPDGYVWGALDVQVCVPDSATLSNQPWYLRYADNTTIAPSSTGYSQFPKPEYIWGERNVAAGSCTRGWITFAVPKDVRPAAVVYSIQDAREGQWTVK